MLITFTTLYRASKYIISVRRTTQETTFLRTEQKMALRKNFSKYAIICCRFMQKLSLLWSTHGVQSRKTIHYITLFTCIRWVSFWTDVKESHLAVERISKLLCCIHCVISWSAKGLTSTSAKRWFCCGSNFVVLFAMFSFFNQ